MLNLLFHLLARLPLGWLHAAGAVLGRLVFRASPRYREHLLENLAQASLGDQTPARRAAEEAGKSVLELPYVWFGNPKRVLGQARAANWRLVEEAQAARPEQGRNASDAKKGIIFLTPHLGCFEITARLIAATPPPDGTPITVLYRPPRKPWLTAVMEAGRAKRNLATAPANLQGVRQMVRALKRGEAIGMLPDQVPSAGEGVWAPFFGKPAFTMTLPAKLQQLSGATILLTYGERLPRGKGWIVHFDRFDDDLSGPPEEQAARINAAIEGLIRNCPEQYFWGYDRYKSPKGAARPKPPAEPARAGPEGEAR